jgi:AcrR family transcriptional regulator
MPKNRQQIPREERAGELLTAATELFLRNGYAGTTMAEISAAAGVAPANVYWYFPSKDDIFAAVMDRRLSREARALDQELAGLDPLAVLVRGLTDMRWFRGLHQSMHHRMDESAKVREAHDRFLGWIRANADRVLEQHPLGADREMVADIVVSLFEGANAFDPPLRPSTEMILFVFSRLGVA